MSKQTKESQLTRRKLLIAGAAMGLSGCQTAAVQRQKFDVVVIGAGLAGLNAALTLQSAGASVLVLEAHSRVGGRTFTARDMQDRGEYGAIQVADTYTRFLQRATEFDLTVDRFPHAFPAPLYCVGKHKASRQEWPDSPANPFYGDHRSLTPGRHISAIAAASNPLQTTSDWSDPRFAAQDISISTLLKQAGYSDEAYRLANHNANQNSADQVSVLSQWRSQLLLRSARKSMVLLEGTDALAKAMANALKRPPRLTHTVRSIQQRSSGYQIDGQDFSVNAAKVIVAIPPAAANRIDFNNCLPATTQAALPALPFIAATQIFVDCDPFWENDGESTYMWTDGPLQRWFPRIDAASGETVGFKIWLSGHRAIAADNTNSGELAALVTAELKRLRPASEGRNKIARINSWQFGSLQSNGAFPQWPAGNTASVARNLRTGTNDLQLAGDYMATHHSGLEGALESGDQAARMILGG